MLKSINLFILLGFVAISSANAQNNTITFSDVEQVENKESQQILFDRATVWFEEKALVGDMELLVKGKDQLVGNVFFDYDAKTISGGKMVKGKIKCTLIVSVKEGRYKYAMKNFEHIPDGVIRKKYSFGILTRQSTCPDDIQVPLSNENWKDKVWRNLKLKSKYNAQTLAKELRVAMNSEIQEADLIGSDW